MNTIDLLFLAGFSIALVAMLVFSKVIRAILWDTIRHPFTTGWVEVDENGKVSVHHGDDSPLSVESPQQLTNPPKAQISSK